VRAKYSLKVLCLQRNFNSIYGGRGVKNVVRSSHLKIDYYNPLLCQKNSMVAQLGERNAHIRSGLQPLGQTSTINSLARIGSTGRDPRAEAAEALV
jgi:hypothetical protein